MVKKLQREKPGYNVSELSRLLDVTAVSIRNWEKLGIIQRDLMIGRRKVFSAGQIARVFNLNLDNSYSRKVAYISLLDKPEFISEASKLGVDELIYAKDIPNGYAKDGGFIKLLREIQSGTVSTVICSKLINMLPFENKRLFRIFCDNIDVELIELKKGED